MNRFKKNKKQLSVFITAGYPSLESTTEQIIYLQEKGIDFIEVGIPFSDPMADGETIQRSSEVALKNGMNIEILFQQLESIKDLIKVPIVLMGYFNPIYKYGFDLFMKRAEKCNISGFIIPDLNFELAQARFTHLLDSSSIPLIHLITPKSSDAKIKSIVKNSSKGFIYLVSSNSTTGNKNYEMDTKRYEEIKDLCDNVPLFIGFGIKNKKNLLMAQEFSDGAIIGSAYIEALRRNEQEIFLSSILN